MTLPRVRARFVLNDVGCLNVVYPRGADVAYITNVAATLSREAEVIVKVMLARVEGERKKSPIIEVESSLNTDALRRLKELTAPELPVAIAVMTIRLLLCKCDFLSIQYPPMQFVKGFEPEDLEGFRLWYIAAIQKLPIGDLLTDTPTSPHALLMDAIENVLRSQGARVTSLNIEASIDVRPCTHRTGALEI